MASSPSPHTHTRLHGDSRAAHGSTFKHTRDSRGCLAALAVLEAAPLVLGLPDSLTPPLHGNLTVLEAAPLVLGLPDSLTPPPQTRRKRENDHAAYQKMAEIRRNMAAGLFILETLAKRERRKRDVINVRPPPASPSPRAILCGAGAS
jgi:hypothetical protein